MDDLRLRVAFRLRHRGGGQQFRVLGIRGFIGFSVFMVGLGFKDSGFRVWGV